MRAPSTLWAGLGDPPGSFGGLGRVRARRGFVRCGRYAPAVLLLLLLGVSVRQLHDLVVGPRTEQHHCAGHRGEGNDGRDDVPGGEGGLGDGHQTELQFLQKAAGRRGGQRPGSRVAHVPDDIPRVGAGYQQRVVQPEAAGVCHPGNLQCDYPTHDQAQSPRNERGETGDHRYERVGHRRGTWETSDPPEHPLDRPCVGQRVAEHEHDGDLGDEFEETRQTVAPAPDHLQRPAVGEPQRRQRHHEGQYNGEDERVRHPALDDVHQRTGYGSQHVDPFTLAFPQP